MKRTKIELRWWKGGKTWEVYVRGKSGAWEPWYGGGTKAEMLIVAVKHAKAHQPSSLVIRKKDGKFQEERTYPRSSDPRRRKG